MERKSVKPLTDREVRNAPYTELRSRISGQLLPNRIPHKDGMYLSISPSGTKAWRYDFRFAGERCVITYGQYPAVSIKDAEAKHFKAKQEIAAGRNPALLKQQAKQEGRKAADSTFKSVAADWIAEEMKAKPKSPVWESNIRRWIGWAEKDFGNVPLPEIQPAMILALLKRTGQKAPTSAEFCRQTVSRIFDYGIRNLLAPKGFNPADAVQGAIIVPEKKHRPKLDAKELPQFFADLNKADAPERMKIGVKLLLHCFPRKEELAGAPWSEIDLDAGLWTISAERMKMKRSHVVPLSRQAVAYFRRLRELAGAEAKYVFPSKWSTKAKPATGQNFNYLINGMGYEGRFTPHGVRSTAASILADAGWAVEVIDAALAHLPKGQTQRAYFRGDFLDRRRELMAAWSDMLDGFETGAKVVAIRSGKAA